MWERLRGERREDTASRMKRGGDVVICASAAFEYN
jgi:hypothetical protein